MQTLRQTPEQTPAVPLQSLWELALQLLVEGNSIRSVERITQIHRDTVLNFLLLAGERCERLHLERVRNVTVRYASVSSMNFGL